MKKISFLIVFVILGTTACKKYEDGPSLSLRTKKARLCGEWQLESLTDDGTDITADYKSAVGGTGEYHIEKDGTYHIHGSVIEEGAWKFRSKKEQLVTQSNVSGAEEEVYTILKLKNSELWLRHVHDDGTLEFHFKQ
jgi:hypothetical protein